MRFSTPVLLVSSVAWAVGCGAPKSASPGEASQPEAAVESTPAEYALETDSEIPEGETIILTAGSKVYQCTKVADASGRSKVQCSDGQEGGLSLHRQK